MRKPANTSLALALVITLQASVQAGVTYTDTYADAGDTPIYGTMIGPSGYYQTDGGDPMTAGNALDRRRVYMYDVVGAFQMLKWDMGFATDRVRVYPDIENAVWGWDYLQWSLWGSNSGAEDPGAWTLLWNPTGASGSSPTDGTVATFTGSASSVEIWRRGTGLDVGLVPGDLYSDAFTMDFGLADSYRYFGVRASTMAWNAGHYDPEINAVATTAIPLPGAALLGGIGVSLVTWLRKRRTL